MPTIVDVIGSYRQSYVTGSVTAFGAGTNALGHLFVMRWATAAPKAARIRRLEAEFLLTTAFTAAQEVGCDVHITRSYSAAHSGGTAITPEGKRRAAYPASSLTARVAAAVALGNGTHTSDTHAIAGGSFYAGAVGARLEPMEFDFSIGNEPGGIILVENEGIIVRNLIAMGAAGVGKWRFSVEWDDVLIG
jgi:hypothetical protein